MAGDPTIGVAGFFHVYDSEGQIRVMSRKESDFSQ